MFSIERPEEVARQVTDPSGTRVEIFVERSGSVHWQYGVSGSDVEIVGAPALALLNLLSHHLVWRRGWLIRAVEGDKRIWRKRYRNRAAAMAALPGLLEAVEQQGGMALQRHK